MNHTKNYEKYKAYYESVLWSKEKLHNVVGKKNGITPEEFEEICGQPYEVDEE